MVGNYRTKFQAMNSGHDNKENAYQVIEYTPIHRCAIGRNAFINSFEEIIEFGEKPFIITGKMTWKGIPQFKKFMRFLREKGANPVHLAIHAGEPTSEDVDRAVAKMQKAGCDYVVGFGGGSALDFSKAVSGTVLSGYKSWDLVNWGSSGPILQYQTIRRMPIICIPTTIGPGSERNGAGVLINSRLKEKGVFVWDELTPNLSIIDPLLTGSFGLDQISRGAIDILAHGLENITMAEELSEKEKHLYNTLIEQVYSNLMQLSLNEKSMNARENLLYLAGIVWGVEFQKENQDWIIHATAHILGANSGIGHSALISFLFPNWIKFLTQRDNKPFLGGITIDPIVEIAERFVTPINLVFDPANIYKTYKNVYLREEDGLTGNTYRNHLLKEYLYSVCKA